MMVCKAAAISSLPSLWHLGYAPSGGHLGLSHAGGQITHSVDPMGGRV